MRAPLPVPVLAGGAALAARVGIATWSFLRIPPDGGEPTPADGRLAPAVHALWHEQLLPLAVLHRARDAVALVSRHRDGEVLARVLRGLGYATARGSSGGGGAVGLRTLAAAGRSGRPLAVTPDGPRGPRRRCKPGVALAAAVAGLPVVPVGAAVTRGWRLASWDRFLIPAPGATVLVAYGAPIPVHDADPDRVDRWTRRIEDGIERCTRSCEEEARRRHPRAPVTPAPRSGGSVSAR